MLLRLASALVLSLTLASTSCAGLEEAFDCLSVCDAYAECYDPDSDVSACTTNCEDMADLDPDYALRVNDCQACLDSMTCTDPPSFQCTAECTGIVP